jgi:ABC-type ATPase involved in cell division
MEFEFILVVISDFVNAVQKKNEKVFEKLESYDFENMNYSTMKMALGVIFNTYLLMESYTVNNNSPIVLSYHHIMDMIDQANTSNFEKDAMMFKIEIKDLKHKLKELEKID